MTKEKDWYVIVNDAVIAGPLRTRREARRAVWRDGRDRGDTYPWGNMSPRDSDWPSFYSILTDLNVYYVGLGSALHDAGFEDALARWRNG